MNLLYNEMNFIYPIILRTSKVNPPLNFRYRKVYISIVGLNICETIFILVVNIYRSYNFNLFRNFDFIMQLLNIHV